MPDRCSRQTRSFNMSMIKGKNTKPEIVVRKYLFSKGFRYRINDKRYPGHPDIILPKYKTAIFVNGCFWHVHEGCADFVWPKTNVEFWRDKLKKNQIRDDRNYTLLREAGWKVIIVWECELGKGKREERMSWLVQEIKPEHEKGGWIL